MYNIIYIMFVSKLYSQGIFLLRVLEGLVQCVLFSSMLCGIRVLGITPVSILELSPASCSIGNARHAALACQG